VGCAHSDAYPCTAIILNDCCCRFFFLTALLPPSPRISPIVLLIERYQFCYYVSFTEIRAVTGLISKGFLRALFPVFCMRFLAELFGFTLAHNLGFSGREVGLPIPSLLMPLPFFFFLTESNYPLPSPGILIHSVVC